MNMITTGVAGMTAASTSLMVTSTNIANASVVGYSRQQAIYSSAPGGTVYVSDIERLSDNFYVSRQQAACSDLGHATTYTSQAKQLESAIKGDAAGLSPAINALFGSLSSAQAEPMTLAYRQSVLSDARNLAARYNEIDNNMNQQLDSVNKQAATMTNKANTLLNTVANLNGEISRAEAADGASPNLLDQRDQMVQELSELVGVDVVYQPDNTVDLSLPNGEPLVFNNSSSQLKLVDGNPDAQIKSIGIDTGTHTKPVETIGGAIQGQLDFRDDVLLPAQDQLHTLGKTLTTEINDVLAQGYDLEDNAGQPLFSLSQEGQLTMVMDEPGKLAFSANPDEPGNNKNLLALCDLKDQKLIDGMTLNGAWNGLVIDVAEKTSEAESHYEASKALHKEAADNVASFSGVNLDEEAANLMVFQQAYGANAKVVAAADEMFKTVLAL